MDILLLFSFLAFTIFFFLKDDFFQLDFLTKKMYPGEKESFLKFIQEGGGLLFFLLFIFMFERIYNQWFPEAWTSSFYWSLSTALLLFYFSALLFKRPVRFARWTKAVLLVLLLFAFIEGFRYWFFPDSDLAFLIILLVVDLLGKGVKGIYYRSSRKGERKGLINQIFST